MAAATRHSTSARLAPYLPNKPPRLDPLSQSQARSGAGPAYKICALALKRATFLVSGRFATSVAVSHPHTTLVHSNDVDTHKSHIIKLDKNRRGEAQCQSVPVRPVDAGGPRATVAGIPRSTDVQRSLSRAP